jgi:hypothetical protein
MHTTTEFDQLLGRLAAPARRALASAGVHSFKDLTQYSEKEVASWHGIGKNALVVIKQFLEINGLYLLK